MNEKDDKALTTRGPATTKPAGDSRVIVIDIGKKQKKKAIKRLRQGRGRLMPKIEAAVKDIQQETGTANALPIVFVVQKKRSRRFLW